MFDPHPFSAALAGPASVPEVAKHIAKLLPETEGLATGNDGERTCP